MVGRNALIRHKREFHTIPHGGPWNRGLTKETDIRVAQASAHVKDLYKNGTIKAWCDGKHLPDEMKLKISESMKKAHAEGRAHNIGTSRWNNIPSYPEKWFMEVINNEFNDREYIREFPFFKYSLDFAWPHKKKCIEIDGEQHQRFIDYIERDKRKDEKLKENGWNILRLQWKLVYNNPTKYIIIAKQFIDNN